MKVIILAGGMGFRLRPMLGDKPKPMAEFNRRPFLEYQLLQLRAQEFDEIVLCVGYRAEQIQGYFGSGQSLGIKIDYVVERELLGTGGAIKNACNYINGTFLVLNGDSFLDIDFRHLVNSHLMHHRQDKEAIATIVAVSVSNVAAYGCLHLDEQGTIHRFAEKRATGPGWINGGAYVFEPGILEYISAHQVVSLEKTIFPLLLNQEKRFYSYLHQGFFVDIGTPSGYRDFDNFVKKGMAVYENL